MAPPSTLVLAPRSTPPSLPPPPFLSPPAQAGAAWSGAPSGPPGPPSPRPRRRFGPAAVVAGLVVALTLAFDLGPLVLVALLFVVIVPFEKFFPRHRQRVRRPQIGTDIAYALVSTPLTTVGLVAGLVVSAVSLFWLPGLLFRPLVLAVPPLPRAILGVFLFDLLLYWVHRFAHEVPFLWRFHKIHHSTEHLDWVSGFRAHPLDGVILAPPFVLLVVAGFEPAATGAFLVVQVIAALFLHANVSWRLRPLQRIVATPEFHHWHHSNQREAHHTNYSALFPIHDMIFGTYRVPRDRRPEVYGVDDPVSPGIIGQIWDPFRGLRNPIRMLRHPIAATRELLLLVRRGIGQITASARRPVRRAPPMSSSLHSE